MTAQFVNAQPLAGKTIVVTRAQHQASSLSLKLRALGTRVIEIPAIEIAPPESYAPLDEALRNIGRYEWLIVTSANAVRVLGERIASLGLAIDTFSRVQCVAVGSSTADGLRGLGLRVALIPGQYIAEAVVEALRERVTGSQVLLARAAVARDIIPDELRRLGATVEVVEAYRTVIPQASIALIREVFLSSQDIPDAVTFTSSSTATNFLRLLHDAGIGPQPRELRALSIGPITSATLREYGWIPAAEANPHNVDGLVQVALRVLG